MAKTHYLQRRVVKYFGENTEVIDQHYTACYRDLRKPANSQLLIVDNKDEVTCLACCPPPPKPIIAAPKGSTHYIGRNGPLCGKVVTYNNDDLNAPRDTTLAQWWRSGFGHYAAIPASARVKCEQSLKKQQQEYREMLERHPEIPEDYNHVEYRGIDWGNMPYEASCAECRELHSKRLQPKYVCQQIGCGWHVHDPLSGMDLPATKDCPYCLWPMAKPRKWPERFSHPERAGVTPSLDTHVGSELDCIWDFYIPYRPRFYWANTDYQRAPWRSAGSYGYKTPPGRKRQIMYTARSTARICLN